MIIEKVKMLTSDFGCVWHQILELKSSVTRDWPWPSWVVESQVKSPIMADTGASCVCLYELNFPVSDIPLFYLKKIYCGFDNSYCLTFRCLYE